jgi:hypothetical protein
MSPISSRTVSTGDETYPLVFVGPVDHPAPVEIDPANFTANEIDADGYLKPGVPLEADGTLVGAAPAFVYGCNIEAVKVAESNSGADLAAADPVVVNVATICQVNRDLLEDVLGRALTANELAGFAAAGSRSVLIG